MSVIMHFNAILCVSTINCSKIGISEINLINYSPSSICVGDYMGRTTGVWSNQRHNQGFNGCNTLCLIYFIYYKTLTVIIFIDNYLCASKCFLINLMTTDHTPSTDEDHEMQLKDRAEDINVM